MTKTRLAAVAPAFGEPLSIEPASIPDSGPDEAPGGIDRRVVV